MDPNFAPILEASEHPLLLLPAAEPFADLVREPQENNDPTRRIANKYRTGLADLYIVWDFNVHQA